MGAEEEHGFVSGNLCCRLGAEPGGGGAENGASQRYSQHRAASEGYEQPVSGKMPGGLSLVDFPCHLEQKAREK